MLSDWQIFWWEHRHWPRLKPYEYIGDDGEIRDYRIDLRMDRIAQTFMRFGKSLRELLKATIQSGKVVRDFGQVLEAASERNNKHS